GERTNAEARAPAAELAVVRCGAGRPRDVEVHPRHVADERLEEDPRGQRAGVPVRPDVAEVCNLRVELLVVLGGQRERPDRLPDSVRRRPGPGATTAVV